MHGYTRQVCVSFSRPFVSVSGAPVCARRQCGNGRATDSLVNKRTRLYLLVTSSLESVLLSPGGRNLPSH